MRRQAGALILVALVAAATVTQGATAESRDVALPELLSRLALRASLHESSLYRFQCIENIVLRKYRKTADRAEERSAASVRQRVLVEKGKTGNPREVRLAMTKENGVRLDSLGRPVEVALPDDFRHVAQAFPHAQAASFSVAEQRGLEFAFVGASPRASIHRIECPGAEDVALEFIDMEAPRRRWLSARGTRCDARASGQMCLEPRTAEITAIEFYGTKLVYKACAWDFAHPFARVELGFAEPRTGIRFPTRVETVVPMGRDVGVFTQHFIEYDFSSVHVEVRDGVHR